MRFSSTATATAAAAAAATAVMADPPNPRNQPQRDRFSTPPPGAAFSTPPPSAASVGAGGDTLLLSNHLRLASKKSEVLLCDWWLVAAAEAREGRRLCVGGIVAGRCPRRDARSGSKSLLSPWQKAERVFESAPITKRHDAFTLGTADGITLRIQGVVNQARSHQNGFPLEVSDGFLVGFPYNWDSYAGAFFEETYNGASAPANAASANDISQGCLFTEYLDDFTLPRIHGASMDGIDGLVTKKFRDFRERFCNRYSGNTTKRMLSDVQDCTTPTVMSCLPQETPNRLEGEITDGLVAEGLEHMSHFEEVSVSSPSGQWETLVEGLSLTPVLKEPLSEKENYEKEINRNKHENGTNDGLAAGPFNATGCHRDVLQADGVGGENSSAVTANIQHNILLGSSSHLTFEVDILYVKATVVQKVPSLENIPEQRKKKKNYLRKKTKSSLLSKKKQSSLSVNQDSKKTSLLRSSRKTIWRPSYDSQCPLTRDRATKLCIASPESLDLKRSRAGRLLVPRIEEWCQRIVYAKDGEIAAISGDNLDNFPVTGIHSEPPRKRRRHV